jgi:hypothetical protein
MMGTCKKLPTFAVYKIKLYEEIFYCGCAIAQPVQGQCR